MSNEHIGKIIKQHRVMSGLTLHQLSEMSGVSPSHLGRIERGERFPSANILRKIAKALDFEEVELFSQAGFLSPKATSAENHGEHSLGRLDPYVARILSEKPVEVQHTVIGILTILERIAKAKD